MSATLNPSTSSSSSLKLPIRQISDSIPTITIDITNDTPTTTITETETREKTTYKRKLSENEDNCSELTTDQQQAKNESIQKESSTDLDLEPVKKQTHLDTTNTTDTNIQDLQIETFKSLKQTICIEKFKNVINLSSLIQSSLLEQYYLEHNLSFIEFDKWKQFQLSAPSSSVNPILQTYLNDNFNQQQRSKLTDLDQLCKSKLNLTESSLISSNHFLVSNNNKLNKNDQTNTKSIAERAKHEAQILQRISQLRKEGLWSIKRLPKLVEPTRTKTHWDYLLDEMVWMSTDFQQERKWKINTSKKIALSIQKYFKDKELKAELVEKEEQKRLRKQAQLVAKEIQLFWKQVEKIIEYKQKTLFEEKRKQQMDKHLNFIVDQTEKYSSWLMEGLNQTKTSSETTTSKAIENKSKADGDYENDLDDDDIDEEEEEDNESTIESEEEKLNTKDRDDEIEKLKMESELTLDDLLKDYNLDENYFKFDSNFNNNHEMFDSNEKKKINQDESEEEEEEEDDDLISDDEEVCSDDMSEEEDDEETIEQDEKFMSCDYDAERELAELKADSDLPIDQLLEQLSKPTKKLDEVTEEITPQPPPSTTETNLNGEENSQDLPKTTQDDNALNSIAAQAQSFQPTGYTLETTNVKTPVPSLLLKHSLREYQHVGLDWLVTMYENKLNGILADEMGLGKTIQTIALLAHLAVEKSIWGPHLIVVPTSVMLNWELEFKKWCPAFKILTYYGNPKERRLKRQGWTKVNAFHVCITSYKLVIQDHGAFRRKKWKYFILDEAQNIKNFKSQRWQSLLNFQSQRRLLLTGTPLQNNLMELWSLMHFLMPHVFSSHREFQHWFSNPLKCMIEGNQEYNEQLIKRLHKVLRPFILRRLKIDVEKQMPKKYEHVVRCKLSKRQRLLYDEFMSLSSTKEKLAEGRYMSVINILMQLRKVCNHPDLFDPRPIVSPFACEPIIYQIPSLIFNIADECLDSKLENIFHYHPSLVDMELTYSAFSCHRSKRLQTPKKLIDEIMTQTPAELQPTTLKQSSDPLFNINKVLLNPSNNSNDHQISLTDNNKYFYDSKTEGLCISESDAWRNKFKQINESPKNELNIKTKTQYITRLNRLKCTFLKPMYGTDLQEFIGEKEIFLNPLKTITNVSYQASSHTTCFSTQTYDKNKHKMNIYWSQTKALNLLVNLIKFKLFNEAYNQEYLDLLNRFVLYVPKVMYSTKNSFDLYDNSYIKLNISKPNTSFYDHKKVLIQDITATYKTESNLNSLNQLNQLVERQMCTQFPEKRLIQYDCGKLQTLADLLRQLFSEQHRVLIFTQMTRMLDILENFLNYHGYKYLRLDGSTSIEQRQALMERFNNDKRIFCFILSTRSGGIGVNLTGADTVVFYDSDWNPTMDAQAQDRCHRIGQTRDVHIYRLISDKTVEENILKKANQKRLLSEMTIEGGCFTTAVLKKHHITELFTEDDEPLISNPTNTENIQVNSLSAESPVVNNNPPAILPPPLAIKDSESQFEEALALVEDESDVKAAKELKEEVRADIDEFDENDLNATNATNANETNNIEMNKIENEFKLIETELKPIERYALKFLETHADLTTMLNQDQDIEIEQVKRDWELNRLKRLKEEEERKAEQDEDDMMFTYTKTELWCPLTPPMHESDVFIDNYEPVTSFLYESEPIPESLLPPVYNVKRPDKRKTDSVNITSISPAKKQNIQNLQSTVLSNSTLNSANTPSSTVGNLTITGSSQSNAISLTTGSVTKASVKMENIIIPRPLFDKANTALIKLRRDIKMQKLKGWPTFKLEIIKSTLPIPPEYNFGKDDWLPNDDFIILYTLQVVLELPLNLQLIAPAHQPNWDLISDLVSSNNSKLYRSPLDCKKRFENVILKREEMCLTEIQNKKQQLAQQQQQQSEQGGNKTKQANKPTPLNICKTKTLRTNQLYIQDNFKTMLQNQKKRFDKINQITKKKSSPQFALSHFPSSQANIYQPLNQQQQIQYEILLNRFNQNPATNIAYNSPGNYSSTVMNAMNAVAVACKQQLPGQQQQQQVNLAVNNITPESITFKTPKYLAEFKLIKERQSKIVASVVAVPSTPTIQIQATPNNSNNQITQNQIQIQTHQPTTNIQQQPQQTPQQNIQQQQQQQQVQQVQAQQNKPQIPQQKQQVQHPKSQNQTILSHLQQQQQQKETAAIASQLAATAAAVAAATEARSNQSQIQQQSQQKTQQQKLPTNLSPSTQANSNILKQQQTIALTTISQNQQQPTIQLAQQFTQPPTIQQLQAKQHHQQQQQQQQNVNIGVTQNNSQQITTIIPNIQPVTSAGSPATVYYQSPQQSIQQQQQQQPSRNLTTEILNQQITPTNLRNLVQNPSITIQSSPSQAPQQITVASINQINPTGNLILPISSTNTVTANTIQQQQPQQQQQTQQTSAGPQTISSIINNQNQQQQQHTPQQPIRLYQTQQSTGKNINQTGTSSNELRKRTTVAGITALNQSALNSSLASANNLNTSGSSNQQVLSHSQPQVTLQQQQQTQQSQAHSIVITQQSPQQQQTHQQHATLKQIIQNTKRTEQTNKQLAQQQQQQQQQQQAQSQQIQQVQVHQIQQQQTHQQNMPATITITTPSLSGSPIQQQQQQQQTQKLMPTLSLPIQLTANQQTVLSRQASNNPNQQQQQQPTMILTTSSGNQMVHQQTSNTQSQINTQQSQSQSQPQPQQQQQQQAQQINKTGTFLIRQHPQIQSLTTTSTINTPKPTPTPSNITNTSVTASTTTTTQPQTLQISKQQDQQQPSLVQQQTTQIIQQVSSNANNQTTSTQSITTQPTTITKINTPSNPTGQVITVTPSISNTQTNQNNNNITSVTTTTATIPTINTTQTSTSTTSTPTHLTTVFKPINSVTYLPTQTKQGIITNQPQQFRQFHVMTTTSGAGGTTSNIQSGQPTTQVVIQQPGQSVVGQPIRKVGSSTNLATIQQKVQVINRPGIQIVPQRLAKTTPTTISTNLQGVNTITTTNINNPNTTTTANVNTTTPSGASTTTTTTTSTPTPVQFQQVFQQQASKLQSNQPPTTSSTTINIQSLGSGLSANQTTGSSLSSLMSGPNTTIQAKPSIIPPLSTSSTPSTVKTLLAGSNPTPIISITTTSSGLNTGIQQAVPINLNSSLSQVLRQFSAVNSSNNSSINIQPLGSTNITAPTAVTLIQTTPSSSTLNINSDTQQSSSNESNGQILVQNVNNNETSNLTGSSDAQLKENK